MSGYVLVRGQVFRREEKAPFVRSGKSVLGAMEFDPAADAVRCHECGKWFQDVGHHLRSHGIRARDYKVKHGLMRKTQLATPLSVLERATRIRNRIKQMPEGWRGKAAPSLNIGRKRDRRAGGERMELRNERALCDAQLVSRIKSIADAFGRSPSMRDVPRDLARAAVKYLGGWRTACLAAGQNPTESGGQSKYTVAILRELLIDFYVLNKHIPRHRDFGTGSLPCRRVYRRYFGSVLAAIDAAGLGLVAKKSA